MVIRTADGGQVQLRSFPGFAGTDVIPQPGAFGGNWAAAGRRVTPEKAYGLPPVLRGIRVISETLGSLPIILYRGDPSNPDTKTVVSSAPQYDLLAKKPNALQTPFAFKAYLASCIEGRGNAYILKAKSRGAVQEMWPIDPQRVTPEPEGLTIKYKVAIGQGRTVNMTRADLIHIPGILTNDPFVGVSPIMLATNAIGTALAAEEFAGRFFDNDATPGGVLQGAANSTSQQMKELKEVWDDGHRSARLARKIGALYGGAEFKQIGVDAQAAQIIETQKWTVDQAANVLGLPAWILGGADHNPRSTPEERNTELLQFSLAGKFVAIEQALHADDDLFPDKDLAPQFLADGLLRASTLMRYQAYHMARQAGWMNSDEIRTKENLPDMPDGLGKTFLETPVGGAPNLQPGAAESPGGLEPAAPVT